MTPTLLALGALALVGIGLLVARGSARDATGAAAPADALVGRYGRNLPAVVGSTLRYPDFELRYLGERAAIVRPPAAGAASLAIVFHDYRVSAGGAERTVAWSSGLGEIAPVPFEIAGRRFVLERGLTRWGPHGPLADGEIVVWRGEDADAMEAARGERLAREARAREGHAGGRR